MVVDPQRLSVLYEEGRADVFRNPNPVMVPTKRIAGGGLKETLVRILKEGAHHRLIDFDDWMDKRVGEERWLRQRVL